MRVTADSDIPLWIWDEDGEESIPCTRYNAMTGGTAFGITVCEGGYDKNATLVIPHTHVVPPFTMPFDITLSDPRIQTYLHGQYVGTVFIDGANGIVHVNLDTYPEGAVGPRITATSPIPLYFCAGGDAPKLIPHTVSARILGEASQLLTGTTEADILEYYHVDFMEERVYTTVRGGYEITATWNLGKGTVHFELTPVAQLSPPTYDIELTPPDYAWIQMTCCIRECGEICGTHIPSPSDEYDECHYEIQISEDRINWKDTGADIEELTPNTTYAVRVRTVDMPGHRCASSDWVIKSFTILSEGPQVIVDIPASIAAGGIPEAVSTGRDEEITFIVKNLGTEAVVADVFLTFENHDIPRVYPHDLTGLEPLGYGYGLPGSDILILEDAYVAKEFIAIGAGASSSYMITVQLPHDAIPSGEASATYTIKTKVGVYQ